jgi:teichuronic acid biosynthesis glycosyltransferase TuaC
MNKKNLLIVTNCFPNIKSDKYNCHFVYEYVNLIKKKFNTIYVISPMSYIPKTVRNFPLFKKYATDYIETEHYKVDNIKIYYPKIGFFPLNIFSTSFKIKRGLKLIKKIVSKLNFELIHSHFIFPSGYYSKEISKEKNKPFLVTSHEGNIRKYFEKREKQKKMIKEVLRQANKIIAVSAINKTYIQKKIPNVKNIKVINNFIDSNNFCIKDKDKSRKKLHLNKKSFILLNIANLKTHKKGQLDLIKLIKHLKSNDIKLYLIGKGTDREKIKKEIRKYKLEDKIKLVGALNNSTLIDWYNAADLFVFPSYYESFGIVQIEALACGTSVIAYDNDGSKEVLRGYKKNLIKKGDIETLVRKIEKKLRDKRLNSLQRRRERREYVKNNFSEEKTKKELLKIYKELLNRQD